MQNKKHIAELVLDVEFNKEQQRFEVINTEQIKH